MHVDIPYTSIMTSFIFFEKLESAFGPAVPNTPSIENTLNEDTLLKCTAAAPTIKPATGTISCCACCSECCWLVCCCKAC